MGLYPRQRPRENADSLADRADGERRAERRDYVHDDRTSPIRSSWVGGRGGLTGRRVEGGAVEPTTPVTEILRLAVVDGGNLRIVSVMSDGTAQATPGSPYALPRTTGIQRVEGMGYSSSGGPHLWIADPGTRVIRRRNLVMGTWDVEVTGAPSTMRGKTVQHFSFGSPGGIQWVVTQEGANGRAWQLVFTGSPATQSWGNPLTWKWLAQGNSEPRGITHWPRANRYDIVDDDRNVYVYTHAELTSNQGGNARARASAWALDSDNRDPSGIAYTSRTVDGSAVERMYVVDTSDNKLYAYDPTRSPVAHVEADDIDFADVGITGNPRAITAYPPPA